MRQSSRPSTARTSRSTTFLDPEITAPTDVIVRSEQPGSVARTSTSGTASSTPRGKRQASGCRSSPATRRPAGSRRSARRSTTSRSATRCCCTRWSRAATATSAARAMTCMHRTACSPAASRRAGSPSTSRPTPARSCRCGPASRPSTSARSVRGHDRIRRGEEGPALRLPGQLHGGAGRGRTGHIGIQALRALSETEIIVVDRNEEALEHARGWGADQTVQARPDGSHVQEIKDRTGGVPRSCSTSSERAGPSAKRS